MPIWIFSGRTPDQQVVPTPAGELQRERGTATRWPATSSSTSSPAVPVTFARIRLDWPRKFATKVVAGFSYSVPGSPICSTRPAFMTAMVSAMVMASSWSCVTCTNVMPDLGLDPLELDLHLPAQLEVERAERLVEQQHRRPVDDGPGQRDPLLLAAGELGRLAPGQVAQLDQLERVVRPSA